MTQKVPRWHRDLFDTCISLYAKITSLIHVALGVTELGRHHQTEVRRRHSVNRGKRARKNDFTITALETCGPQVRAQLLHRDVRVRQYARRVFLSLVSLEPGSQIRVLPNSHKATTDSLLAKSNVGFHLLDIHLPVGFVAVMHPLLVHCGSTTTSARGNRRLHGYHGFGARGLDDKTYKVSVASVIKAIQKCRARRS